MRFSIIIPNYNKGKYIKECLDSIFNQTIDKSKYEVILVDDGSNDESIDIIKKYDLIFLQTNRLMAGGARNKGLDIAKGEYILFLDSDDYLTNNYVLEKLDDLIKDEDVIYLNFQKIGLDDEITSMEYEENILNEKLSNMKFLAPPTKCFKRETLGDLRFIEKCTYEDVSFTLSAMCKFKSETYFKESFYSYRKVANSITTNEVKSKQMIDLIIQITSLYYLCEEYPEYKDAIMTRIRKDNLTLRIDILDKLFLDGINTFREHF